MIASIDATQYIKTHAAKVWLDVLKYYPCAGKLPVIECTAKKTAVAGRAFSRTQHVWYNLAFACTLDNIEQFDNTIAHELAHIVQMRCYPKCKQWHGSEFRSIMFVLGYDGKTYHSYNTRKAKESVVSIKGGDDLLLDL